MTSCEPANFALLIRDHYTAPKQLITINNNKEVDVTTQLEILFYRKLAQDGKPAIYKKIG